MPVSKFIRIGVEGATTDGRNIERPWLVQAAKSFNRAKYGARIWLEHIRGTLPDSMFKALGDVVELKAEEVDLDGQKKMALFAKLDVTDELVAMNKARQKIYTSMEIDPNFAKSNEAYLVGLAVTDSPASLGTEALAFAANAKVNPFATRKLNPENLFTEAVEIELELEEPTETESFGAKLLNSVKALLGKKEQGDSDNFGAISEAIETIAASQKDVLDQFSSQGKQQTETAQQLQKLSDDFAALKNQLETEEQPRQQRHTASGGEGLVKTDC